MLINVPAWAKAPSIHIPEFYNESFNCKSRQKFPQLGRRRVAGIQRKLFDAGRFLGRNHITHAHRRLEPVRIEITVSLIAPMNLQKFFRQYCRLKGMFLTRGETAVTWYRYRQARQWHSYVLDGKKKLRFSRYRKDFRIAVVFQASSGYC